MSNDRAIEVAFDHWGDPAGAAEHLISESGELVLVCVRECVRESEEGCVCVCVVLWMSGCVWVFCMWVCDRDYVG